MKNQSLDDLNIWSSHQRNSRNYYNTCKNITECPNNLSNECLCYRDMPVLPQDIAEWWVPIKLNVRAYIHIGSTCPICLTSINHKRNAWITNCGHSFHRSCLMQSYNSYMNNPNIIKYTNCMPCPMCRYELPTCCCGFEIEKYQQIYGEPRRELDYLENFEMLKDLLIPEECYKCKKYLGMNNNCKECKKYQTNGHDWI